MSYFLLGAAATNTLRLKLANAVAHVSPAVFRTRINAVLTIDVLEKFSALSLPILYLRATQDRVVPRAASELAVKVNPRCKLVDLDAPHFLLQAAPMEAAELITSFALKVQNGYSEQTGTL